MLRLVKFIIIVYVTKDSSEQRALERKKKKRNRKQAKSLKYLRYLREVKAQVRWNNAEAVNVQLSGIIFPIPIA